MYGSVLSGGLAGHVHGTGAYDVTTTGEPEGWRPYIWEALGYASGAQMQHLRTFILSEGPRYQELQLANDAIVDRTSHASSGDGLDGWTFMMRTPDRALAFLYFENGAAASALTGFEPRGSYRWTWFDPRGGIWSAPTSVRADSHGVVSVRTIPSHGPAGASDWAAKLTAAR